MNYSHHSSSGVITHLLILIQRWQQLVQRVGRKGTGRGHGDATEGAVLEQCLPNDDLRLVLGEVLLLLEPRQAQLHLLPDLLLLDLLLEAHHTVTAHRGARTVDRC